MENAEKQLVEFIVAAYGLKSSKLGLRFDRVVETVLARLRTFTNTLAPRDTTVLVAITAPILLPARTVHDLQRDIQDLLSSPALGVDRVAIVRGNPVRLRRVANAPKSAPRLIGFVHNGGTTAEVLFDLAEQWLLSSARAGDPEAGVTLTAPETDPSSAR
ncbi:MULTISPECIES: hypothetical protein [unclassified Brevundimonas]|uniref:hypothetical protein n=1 Tax=unclassified Brevundimonas TaxID=2622653 RepID=UPI0025BF5BE1|nr:MULTISPECIES: hypothetical protein [unclassified Brevundimonas]